MFRKYSAVRIEFEREFNGVFVIPTNANWLAKILGLINGIPFYTRDFFDARFTRGRRMSRLRVDLFCLVLL